MEMQGKVALVAGATSGIGEVTARMFAKAGASVMLAGRRENLLREITEDLNTKGYEGVSKLSYSKKITKP